MARFVRSKDLQTTRYGREGGEGDAGDPLPLYMAASEQKQKPKGGDEADSDDAEGGSKKIEKKGEDLKEEMDSLMDEIDAVLEENAEEFVKNYVQRGGE
jgi:ubiquitin-like protein Pup